MKSFLSWILTALFIKNFIKFGRTEENDPKYKYVEYVEIMKMVNELVEKYPSNIRKFNALDFPDLELPYTTCGNKRCDHIYFQLSDFTQPLSITSKLPQVDRNIYKEYKIV